MGLAPVPKLFTKLTKPILAHLHNLCHVISSFCDSLLVGQSKEEMCGNVMDTVRVFDSLGFTVHDGKSQFMPAQKISLGFILNSVDMTVTLTQDLKRKLVNACNGILRQTKPKIRVVTSCIGFMAVSFPAVPSGSLYYRCTE